MKKTANSKGVVKPKWTEGEVKKYWADYIPPETWDELFDSLNFSSEYPKGTDKSVRNITYSTHLNRLTEIIRLSEKSQFRTDTEIFRVALHHGISLLYNVFCGRDKSKKVRGHLFYEAVKDFDKKMELATIVSVVHNKVSEVKKHISQGNLSKSEGNAELEKLISALPNDDKIYVKKFFKQDNDGNVKNFNREFTRDFTAFD